MIWTDERVAQLKALYFDTHIEWSFSQIAEKLGGGLSRNAVIGKAHRLGLERRRTGAKPGVNRNGLARKPTPTAVNVQKINAARAAPEVKPEPFVIASADVVPLNCTIEELAENGCRFPYGDGPFTFCNHRKMEGSSYCAPHHRMCCTGVPERRGGVSPSAFGKARGGVFGRTV